MRLAQNPTNPADKAKKPTITPMKTKSITFSFPARHVTLQIPRYASRRCGCWFPSMSIRSPDPYGLFSCSADAWESFLSARPRLIVTIRIMYRVTNKDGVQIERHGVKNP
jgi:hypothetical protein